MSNLKAKYTYEATMINGEKAEFSLYSANDTEKEAYLNHFLEVTRHESLYFVANDSQTRYNKTHIVSCKEKEVVNG